MTYSIKIDYTTGCSVSSERTSAEVGMNWEDLDKAKLALQYIKEHSVAYRANESTRSWSRPEYMFKVSSIQDKPWFCGPLDADYLHNDSWQYQIAIQKDDGSRYMISAFWQGYFVTLHGAEIIRIGGDTDHDMKFTC